MCWECYNCVKICPTQAVEVRGYADFVPLGASATPLRSTDSIMWTVKFRNGNLKRFKFPSALRLKAGCTDGGFKTHADLNSTALLPNRSPWDCLRSSAERRRGNQCQNLRL